ncbi:hypothetical protein MRS44_005577 [Fusarium solani]|uniref:uncharacterized protein n=1 Tax=Fusarium solani TaxID=169388 RepID=UPI0032C47CE6|nr:hypothetical protein MRS44_005577 [Fusarium solani]
MFSFTNLLRKTPFLPTQTHDIALDPLTVDAKTLATELGQGHLSSVDLVERSLDMIQKYDGYLHAMLSIVPSEKLKQTAEALDRERQQGKLRGPLHGIPIVVKVGQTLHGSVVHFTLLTVLGQYCDSSRSRHANDMLVGEKTAHSLQKLHDPEWLVWERWPMSVRNPCGSSTGSAVAVSAGYAPLSIGTETDGSLVSPAARAALYTIKPTIGLVSQDGVIPISHTMDSAGPMAKTPYDLATLLDVIAGPAAEGSGDSFISALNGSWGELSIATIDFKKWWPGEDYLKPVESATKQMHTEIQAAYDKMEGLAKRYIGDAPLPLPTAFMLDGRDSEDIIMMADFKQEIDKFLKSVEHSKVRSLRELITFNIEHADAEMPAGYDDQQILLETEDLELSSEDYDKHLSHLRKVARQEGLDYIFQKYEVDVIIGSSDTPITAFASGSGYPVGSVPLGYLDFNGRPFGLAVLAAKNQEAKILKFMSAWEATFGPRKPPPMLQ